MRPEVSCQLTSQPEWGQTRSVNGLIGVLAVTEIQWVRWTDLGVEG